jgi:hypothetical protein
MGGIVRAALLTALLLQLPVQAVASAPCPDAVARRTPAQVAERIDRYFREPRGAPTYRALAGLGDPDVEPAEASVYYRQFTPQQRALLTEMLPDRPGPDGPRAAFAELFPDQPPAENDYWFPDFGACRVDHALRTAEQRVARLGRDHPYVGQWLRAQRAVFGLCRRQNSWESPRRLPAVALPPALETGDAAVAALQRDDRAYQAASILFYRSDPAAARAFARIAASSSPHAPIARYMVAAVAARDMHLGAYHEEPTERAARLQRARTALVDARAMLADPRLAEIHPLAQGLIGYLGYWTGDEWVREAQIAATMEALAAPGAAIARDPVAAERYSRALADLQWLRHDFPEEGIPDFEDPPGGSSVVRAFAARATQDDFAAWLLTPVSRFDSHSWLSPEARRSRFSGMPFEATRRSEQAENGRPWAAIAISYSGTYEPERWTALDALTEEARACPSDDRLAALASLYRHQVRTALMFPALGEDSRPRLDQDGLRDALARVEAWPWRTGQHHRTLVSNMLLYLAGSGRLADARLVRDRAVARDEDTYQNAIALFLLAEDEAHLRRELVAMPTWAPELLNLLPGPVLADLAEDESLPAELRARFARVAWARTYALQRRVPKPLDRLMRRLNPEFTANWTSRPGARPTDRALLLDVLRSPTLNILMNGHQRGGLSMGYADEPGLTAIDTFEHSDNNWWCAWQPDRHRLTVSAMMYLAFFQSGNEWNTLAAAGTASALGPLLRESWLWQAQVEAEQEALAAIVSAPQLLAERAVAWRDHGPGQDEALALAVRATRYGCQRQGGHGRWSRAAHALLHERFPQSEAARRTRWWFDCAHFSGGCAGRPEDDMPPWERWADWP